MLRRLLPLSSTLRQSTTARPLVSFPRMSSSTVTTAPVAAIKITNHETYLSDGIPSPASLLPDPLLQFNEWFNHAGQSVKEHEAFSLTTVSPKGIPSTRYVLLKTVDERGFVFFTNYDSRKGKELFPDGGSKGGYASMAFYWEPLKRSVRIVGRAEKITPEETAEYYHSRPIGSQVGAWASAQSTVLKNREQLEENVVEIEERFDIKDGKTQIPVPPFWGGVRIVGFEVEFWAGRESRLHDRVRYTRDEDSEGAWEKVRLSP